MSVRINEDYDLCWHYLSPTGCKNSNCTWRHENSRGRFYQNCITEARDNGVYYRGDARKKPGAPFYPVKQYQDGGVEDQFGLIHYPDMDKKVGNKKSITFREKLRYWQDFENTHLLSSPMSMSSSGMTSAPTSSACESDSEDDVAKNAMVVSAGHLGKFKKRSSRAFSEDLFEELMTPAREMKMNGPLDDAIRSSFSPFAKVFVPRVNSVTSKDAIIASLTEDDKVYE